MPVMGFARMVPTNAGAVMIPCHRLISCLKNEGWKVSAVHMFTRAVEGVLCTSS